MFPRRKALYNPRQPPACPASACRARAARELPIVLPEASCHIFGGADIGARSWPHRRARGRFNHIHKPRGLGWRGRQSSFRAAVHALLSLSGIALTFALTPAWRRGRLPRRPPCASHPPCKRRPSHRCDHSKQPAGASKPPRSGLRAHSPCRSRRAVWRRNGARDAQAHGLPVSPKIQTLLVNPDMACLPTAAHGPGALIWSRVGAGRRTHSEGQGA